MLARAPIARVRVLLADGRKAVAIKSAAPFRVRDATAKTYQLPAGSRVRAWAAPEGGSREGQGARWGRCSSFRERPLEYAGRAYRGQVQVNVGSARLQVVNNVGLEPYLYGVVQVPNDWPAEALKAQAVVARSYALAVRKTGAFDLYADTRSQVYGGIAAEKPTTNDAVDQTAGQVLMYDGKVATTFFFSTSGGRTANVQDAWRGGVPTPYLVSVADPYDGASPHHTWGPLPFTAPSSEDVPGPGPPRRRTRRGQPLATREHRHVRQPARRRDRGQRLGRSHSAEPPVHLVPLRRPFPRAADEAGRLRNHGAAHRPGARQRLGHARAARRRCLGARGETQAGSRRDGYRRRQAARHHRLPADVGDVQQHSRPRHRRAARSPPPGDAADGVDGIVRPIIVGAKVEIQRLSGSSWRVVARTVLDDRGEFGRACNSSRAPTARASSPAAGSCRASRRSQVLTG